MITAATFFGGSTISSAPVTLDTRARIWVITSGSGTVTLPNVLAPGLPFGAPAFFIMNRSSSSLTVVGTGIVNTPLADGKVARISGVKLSDGSFRWAIDPLKNISVGA